jgi:SAM-dependent methyltransferase
MGNLAAPPQGGRQDHWQRVHGRAPPTAASWHQERPAMSLALIAATGLGRQARILDVGGGAATLVDHLLADGYGAVSVLDIAPAALDLARRRLGDKAAAVRWIVADVTAWSPPRRYDVWHDRAVFHFLTEPADRRAYVATLARALAPNGQAIIATFALEGPERCSGLPCVRYSADTLAAELGPAWRLAESRAEDHVTPGGAIQRFLYGRFARA